ncbi:Zinc-ribbon domain containing protein [Desulfovibrio sp. X2]|uniref:zinc ribbon domain-containing protein n=1 Tax=Desulfovibrio sp. X2 TaxID=941449 RepID=UPI000358C319|nr:zinc ribbon domain-containing protein [Desulfovibrio sp. X2]EPR43607.1 Zinc-ribbon domain containing protein [Desulfovibrio sp. X2]
MIVCTRCGRDNPDDARICGQCGHKLQSGRQWGASDGRPGGLRPEDGDPDDFFDDEGESGLADESIPYRDLVGRGGVFRKHLEAWAYLAILGAAAGAALHYMTLVPIWCALPAVALLAWLRRL